MLAFFKGLIDLLSALVGAVQMMVQSIINLLLLIPQGLSFIQTMFVILPPELVVFATACVAVTVVLFIVGR